MPETQIHSFAAILGELRAHAVDFIVGGVAAALEGAPLNTFDLDIGILSGCCARSNRCVPVPLTSARRDIDC